MRKLLLVIIIFFGFILRFYQIGVNPAGFFADEAANGFNAYKILTTGRDEHGEFMPFYFQSFGDYRNPVTIYSMIFPIALFGLNEFAVRFTMVIYGSLTILCLYLLMQEMLSPDNSRIKRVAGIVAAFFLAVSPWHIQFNRTGFEFTTMPFFLTLGLYFCFKFINLIRENKNSSLRPWSFAVLSALSFVFTFYTYYPIQLVLWPFLLGIGFLYKKYLLVKNFQKGTILAGAVFLIGMIPFLSGVISGKAITRFWSVSPIGNKQIEEVIKPMIETYKDHFSYDFLFRKGDVDMPRHFITRHSVRGLGELYVFQLPLLITGLVFMGLRNFRIFSVILIWILLYPIGSAVVGEGPFAHRSIFGVIPFQILSGYGLAVIVDLLVRFRFKVKWLNYYSKIYLFLLFLIIVSYSVTDYIHKYFVEYPLISADFWGWQYGPREIVSYFKRQSNGYDELIMSHEFNAPQIFLKFYDPKGECKGCMIGDAKRFDPTKKQLFALSKKQLDEVEARGMVMQKQKVINYPNGQVAFVIGELSLFKDR